MTRHRDIQIIYICQYSVHAVPVGSSLEASLQVVLARSASCGARPRPSRYSCVVVVLVVCCKSSLTNGNAPQKADVALLAGCPFDSFEYTSTALSTGRHTRVASLETGHPCYGVQYG